MSGQLSGGLQRTLGNRCVGSEQSGFAVGANQPIYNEQEEAPYQASREGWQIKSLWVVNAILRPQRSKHHGLASTS